MKNIGKQAGLILAAGILMCFQAQAADLLRKLSDTIIINIGENKIIIQVDNQEELKKLQQHSIDTIIASINKEIDNIRDDLQTTVDTSIHIDPTTIVEEYSLPGKINIKLTYQDDDEAYEESVNIRIPNIATFKVEYTEDSDGDLSKVDIDWGKDTCAEREDRLEFGMALGLNNWLDRTTGTFPNGVTYDLNPSQSRFVSLNSRFEFQVGKSPSPAFISTGLSLTYNNYMFDKKVRVFDENNVTGFYIDTVNNVRKSKLRATYISIPLMVNFEWDWRNGPFNRGFHFGFGADVAYRVGSKAIAKFSGGGKEKLAGNYNLNPVQYGLIAQFGYGPITLFGKYNLSPLFLDGKGPDVNTFNIGFLL